MQWQMDDIGLFSAKASGPAVLDLPDAKQRPPTCKGCESPLQRLGGNMLESGETTWNQQTPKNLIDYP